MRHWTTEERQRQAELVRGWQPWQKSTGAKTKAGKERSKMNAVKHGLYSAENKALLRQMRAFLAGCAEVLA